MTTLNSFVGRFVPVVLTLVLSAPALMGQSEQSLPVYQVLQSGALPAQAVALCASLNLPTNGIAQTNGQVAFVDPTNFMAVPTVPMTDPVIISNLAASTLNEVPGIPLRFEQLDFNALSNLTVMSSNAAVNLFATALAAAGLVPPSATPTVSHTLLEAVYTNDDGSVIAVSNLLDTQVSYQLSLGGYPLVGPGAQVQIAFGANGGVTRLLYSARMLSPGPAVAIISPTVASNRAAALMPGFNGVIGVQLVYYAPPLSPGGVTNIIPFYWVTGSSVVTNPATGQTNLVNALQRLIPATDDPGYVPSVSLRASPGNGGTQVVASASVTGGSPPYHYEWSGSISNSPGTDGSQITYTPSFQVPQPLLTVKATAAGSPAISWVDPLGLFQLVSASNLQAVAWYPVTNGVAVSNGISLAAVNLDGPQTAFYRLVLPNQPVPVTHNVVLNVIDANGVFVQSSQLLTLLALPVPITSQVHFAHTMGWGTESPYDQDLGGPDTASWLKSMRANPVFGKELFYRGAFLADPTDFIAPPGGDDNTIVDIADLTFYCGHGNSTSFTFTTLAGGPASPAKWLSDAEPYRAWGNRGAAWLCLLSCDVLDNGQYFDAPNFRWGPDFSGLHEMLGFSTEAMAGCTTGPWGWGSTFEEVFVNDMSVGKHPHWQMTIQASWFDAAKSCNVGNAAVLAPLGPDGVCDVNDWWWGLGTVGPTIGALEIKGWYYVTQSN